MAVVKNKFNTDLSSVKKVILNVVSCQTVVKK